MAIWDEIPYKIIASLNDASQNWDWFRTKLFPLNGEALNDGVIDTNHLADEAVTLDKVEEGIFLELDVSGTRKKIAFGSGTLTWPGASALSNGQNIAHGLGVVPNSAVTTAWSQTGTGSVSVSIEAGVDATNLLTVRGRTVTGFTPANTETTGFGWIAIGSS
jgi:hypothetical protein